MYRQSNPDKVKRIDRDKRQKNPELYKELARKRIHLLRARNAEAISEYWSSQEIAARGTGFCPYCGKEIGLIYDSKVMHIDHIIPLSRGGSNLKENLETVCCKCNDRKGSKTKEEFLIELKEK